MSGFLSTRYVRFHSEPAAVGAVGKWESRALCGISKRGGKVGFLTFPPRGFSTALSAASFAFAHGAAALVVATEAMRPITEAQGSIQMLVHGHGAARQRAPPAHRF